MGDTVGPSITPQLGVMRNTCGSSTGMGPSLNPFTRIDDTLLLAPAPGTWMTDHLATMSVGLDSRSEPSQNFEVWHVPKCNFGLEPDTNGVWIAVDTGTLMVWPVAKDMIIVPDSSTKLVAVDTEVEAKATLEELFSRELRRDLRGVKVTTKRADSWDKNKY